MIFYEKQICKHRQLTLIAIHTESVNLFCVECGETNPDYASQRSAIDHMLTGAGERAEMPQHPTLKESVMPRQEQVRSDEGSRGIAEL